MFPLYRYLSKVKGVTVGSDGLPSPIPDDPPDSSPNRIVAPKAKSLPDEVLALGPVALWRRIADDVMFCGIESSCIKYSLRRHELELLIDAGPRPDDEELLRELVAVGIEHENPSTNHTR